jgi:hypothetical protein
MFHARGHGQGFEELYRLKTWQNEKDMIRPVSTLFSMEKTYLHYKGRRFKMLLMMRRGRLAADKHQQAGSSTVSVLKYAVEMFHGSNLEYGA